MKSSKRWADEGYELALDQGSDEWHHFRRRHRMASTAAIPMGCAPSYWAISKPEHLRQYNRGVDFLPNAYVTRMFEHAHAAEERVRNELNQSRDETPGDFQPRVFVRGKYAASLDGFDVNGRTMWLEVKMVNSPESATWKAAQAGRVMPHHYWQLVHQAYCLPENVNGVHFVVTTKTDERIFLYRLRKNLMKDWEQLEKAWDAFGAGTGPDEGGEHGLNAAREYRALALEHDELKARLDKAKAALIKFGPREYPGVLKVTRYTTRGRIDYKAAAEAHYGEDSEALEIYRGIPSEGHRITLEKEKDDGKDKA